MSRLVKATAYIFLKFKNRLDTNRGIERFYKKLIEFNLIRNAMGCIP
jgi:hypothetical protein